MEAQQATPIVPSGATPSNGNNKDKKTSPKTKQSFLVCGSRFDVDKKYKLIKPIGHGAYGVVCSAINLETGQKVAIKKITKAFANLIETKRTLREIKFLRYFKHSNIIPIVDILKPDSYAKFDDVYLVNDLMSTDLHQIIRSPQPLSDEHTQYFMYQILRGLKYIHSAHVLHRDLKPSNVLLNANCDLKICDFGLARVSDPAKNNNGFLTEYVATRWYRAPEIMLSWKEYTKAIDMWSVGCILAEILLRRPLFPGRDYMHQLHLIIDTLGTPSMADTEYILSQKAKAYVRGLQLKKGYPFHKLFPKASKHALDLLSKLLTFNPAKRLTVEQALEHPYFASLHDPADEPVSEPGFDFDLDKYVITKESLKALLWQEVCGFHPELRESKAPSPSEFLITNQPALTMSRIAEEKDSKGSTPASTSASVSSSSSSSQNPQQSKSPQQNKASSSLSQQQTAALVKAGLIAPQDSLAPPSTVLASKEPSSSTSPAPSKASPRQSQNSNSLPSSQKIVSPQPPQTNGIHLVENTNSSVSNSSSSSNSISNGNPASVATSSTATPPMATKVSPPKEVRIPPTANVKAPVEIGSRSAVAAGGSPSGLNSKAKPFYPQTTIQQSTLVPPTNNSTVGAAGGAVGSRPASTQSTPASSMSSSGSVSQTGSAPMSASSDRSDVDGDEMLHGSGSGASIDSSNSSNSNQTSSSNHHPNKVKRRTTSMDRLRKQDLDAIASSVNNTSFSDIDSIPEQDPRAAMISNHLASSSLAATATAKQPKTPPQPSSTTSSRRNVTSAAPMDTSSPANRPH